jgi:hypothetical protein
MKCHLKSIVDKQNATSSLCATKKLVHFRNCEKQQMLIKTCQLNLGIGNATLQVIKLILKSIMINKMSDASTNTGYKTKNKEN